MKKFELNIPNEINEIFYTIRDDNVEIFMDWRDYHMGDIEQSRKEKKNDIVSIIRLANRCENFRVEKAERMLDIDKLECFLDGQWVVFSERLNPEQVTSEKRTTKAEKLCLQVRNAFGEIKLGAGVGLHEGQAIDDYETDEARRQKRKKDETEAWEHIKSKHLNACYSSLSFFDPLGMRFHLPAFIIADLNDKFNMGMEFTLTHLTVTPAISLAS